MKNSIKSHKVEERKNLTLMLFYDPVKSGITVKVPKWIRFPLIIVFVLIILGGLNTMVHIAELEAQVAINRLEAKEGIYTIQNKEVEIAKLEVMDTEKYDKLNALGLLTVELKDELETLKDYKNVIDNKLGLEKVVQNSKLSKELDNIDDQSVTLLSDTTTLKVEKLEERSLLQSTKKEDIDRDEFEVEVDELMKELEETINQVAAEETLYEKRDEQADIMLPYWAAYPSVVPIKNTYITSYYGYRKNPFGYSIGEFHSGVDFKAHYQDICATGDGIVNYAGYNRGYGYLIVIDHGYGITTKYAHNSKLYVKEGDYVKRYDIISKSGNTGRSTGPHLHYEVLVNGETQNPLDFIDEEEE